MQIDHPAEYDGQKMERILMLGPPGAGKSTFAKRLGDRLNVPVIHLDAEFWEPGWEMPPREEWIETQRELIRSSDRWIMDGNYDRTLEVRLSAADAVILLDVPRWKSLFRIARRRVQYDGASRPDMAEGCPEKADLEFLRYAWTFASEELPEIERKIRRHGSETTVVRLRSSNSEELDAFLESVEPSGRYE